MTAFENADALGKLYGSDTPSVRGPGRVGASTRGSGAPGTGKDKPRKTRRAAPSPDQETAEQRIAEWLQERDAPCFSLIGPAGSGKSWLLDRVVKLARKRRYTVRLSASTHKAAAQVRAATGKHANTTHRILGVKLIEDDETGETKIKLGSAKLDSRTFLVVDEASMLPSRLVEAAVKAAKRRRAKVLFVGDAAQLSPVDEKPSKAVDKTRCDWPMHELTTIHRQAVGNPIIAAATAIRLAPEGTLPILETARREDGSGVVVMENKRAWAELLLEKCANPNEENRYLGFTNAATDAAARAIRRCQFGEAADESPYLVGERLIVNERCVLRDRAEDKGRKDTTSITIENNEEVVVEAVWQDGDRYRVQVRLDGDTITLDAFGSYQARARHLERCAAQARRDGSWRDFFAEREAIADLRSATAATGHKSQGSSYDDVFVNLDELAKCRDPIERQRLAYVIFTRARRTVYVYGGTSR